MVTLFIIIRGHVRNSLQDTQLKDFLKLLTIKYPHTHFIIHTWNINDTYTSWRKIDTIHKDISEHTLQEYFSYDNIQPDIIIDNELTIQIKGKKYNKIGAMPILAWKRMYYGQKKAIDYIQNKFTQIDLDYALVLNIRIDFFQCNTTIKYTLDYNTILNMINKAIQQPHLYTFIYNQPEFDGIDNIYISNFYLMKNIIYHFYNNLDNIYQKYQFLFFHENMLYYESQILLGRGIHNLDFFKYYFNIAANQIKYARIF
tara:strand:- start:3803 stop:4573 length:771 start_codon:yes stop_codon:yes gene_type:complete